MNGVRDIAARVVDPELPQLTIDELGILREAHAEGERAVVTITPTYTACPALDTIRADIAAALTDAGWTDIDIHTVFAPAWTSDWITTTGREKLERAGIAPPGAMNWQSAPPGAMGERGSPQSPPGAMPTQGSSSGGVASEALPAQGSPQSSPGAIPAQGPPPGVRRLPLLPPSLPRCPRCESADVEQLSRFGPTACLALWRCRACAEPFEHFKSH